MKVKAAVVNNINDKYGFEELNLDDVLPHEVLVRVVASGICHSDEAIRIGDGEFPLPVVLGHEGAGIIEKVGSSVKDFAVGDQVIMAYDYCGTCTNCRTGHPSSCTSWAPLNYGFGGPRAEKPKFTRSDGSTVSSFFNQSSFSTYTVTSENNLIKVDPDADLRLVGPLGCGLLTGFGTVVNGLKPSVGSSIAIFGTGAVGLGALMTAQIIGCSQIIAIDIHDSRLEMAKELGATHTINSGKEDLGARITEITGGLGVNHTIDTTGVSAVMKAAIDILSIGGSTVPLAVTPNTFEVAPLTDLTVANRKIVGVLMGDAIPQEAVPQLVEFHKVGKFPFEKLVKYYKFDQINEASEDSNSGKTIKPILIIDEEYRKDDPLV